MLIFTALKHFGKGRVNVSLKTLGASPPQYYPYELLSRGQNSGDSMTGLSWMPHAVIVIHSK